MRGVFVVPGSLGHLHPQAALAAEMNGRGHEATMVTTDDRLESVTRLGLSGVGVGPPAVTEIPRREGASPGETERPPVTFLTDDAAIAALEEVCRDVGADVIVHDHVAPVAAVIARELGIASVYVGVGTMRPTEMMSRISRALAQHCNRVGREEAHTDEMYSHLHLSRCPPSLQPDAFSELPNTVSVQPFMHDGADARAPGWLQEYSDAETVYVTFGSWGAHPATVRRVGPMLTALGAIGCEVIVTLGSRDSVEALDAVAPNVRVEAYVPQRHIMELADLVVCHGGSGAILGALSYGTPVVAVPQGADHFWNCERLTERGVGIATDGGIPDATELQDIVAQALGSAALRNSAQEVEEEIAELPDLADATDLIEQLTGP